MEFNRLNITTLLLCLHQIIEGVLCGVSCPAHIASMTRTHKAIYKDTCYLFIHKEVHWKSARKSCWALGGEMLAVKDQETMDFIKKTLNSKELSWDRNGVWLGANYHNGKWKWTDGTRVTYRNWAPGEPSKVFGILSMENCGLMRRSDNWKWHDYICGTMNYHYNYICQFPAGVTFTTTSTLTTALKKKEIKAYSKMSEFGNGKFKELNSKSDSSNSDLYQRLGHNVYRFLKEKGMSSKSLLNLIQESAMGDNDDVSDPEQATSRVSSSASNQEKDNGNMKIVIIVISLTCGFLFILLIIFLLMRHHNKIVKAKAAERAVRYVNNHSTDNPSRAAVGATTPVITRAGGVEQRPPPPIPATRPPPIDDLYLAPKDINGMYTEVLRPNGTVSDSNHQPNGHCFDHNNYLVNHMGSASPSLSHNRSNSELGACGRSYESAESSPLISGQTLNSSSLNCVHNNGIGTNITNGPTESCTCAVNSEQGNSEYIAMNSLLPNESSSCEKLLNPEDKHTYSNVHIDGREGTAVENHYETLP